LKLQGALEVFLLIPFEGGSLGFWANILKGALEDFLVNTLKGFMKLGKNQRGGGIEDCVF
jgi:hypothetical protein